jgi:hypothetical protein
MVFEGNNFRWHQTTNGSLFYNEEGSTQGLEVPIGESNHTIFASTLIFAGLTSDDQIKATYRMFCQGEDENCYQNWGPLKLDGSLSSTEEVADYNHIWFVNQEQIDLHLDYQECINDPSCDETTEFPNYTIPDDFITWPAEGENGFAENLAPFVDLNGDGSYSPEFGDYPAICGDFSTYTIWNDLGAEGASADGDEIGLEVHTTVYGYGANDGSEFNTLFVQHKLINRGTLTLSESYTGYWSDFDLGNPDDDHVGTEVSRSMFYVLNGDPLDDSTVYGPGYGLDMPVLGIKVLGGPSKDSNGTDDVAEFQSNYANETTGFDDGIIDNERLGLAFSLRHYNGSIPPETGSPESGSDFYNYLTGRWKNGAPVTYGGTGFDEEPNSNVAASYMFPGESDPILYGTNGIDPNYPNSNGWTETSENIPGEDRRMLGSSGPFTFSPGDVQYIDLAYIFARESFDEEETVIETLQRFADEVEGLHCSPLPSIVLSRGESVERKELKLYPNPAQNLVAFELPLEQATMTLFDITGKKIKQAQLQGGMQQIDISKLGKGLYMIRIESVNSNYHGKFIIEK